MSAPPPAPRMMVTDRRPALAPLAALLLALVVALAGLGGACGGERPAPDALRLLHHPAVPTTAAEVSSARPSAAASRLVAVDGPELPEWGAVVPGTPPVPAPGRLARVELTDADDVSDQRLALLARAGTVYRYRLDLGAFRRPRLRLAIAALPAAAATGRAPDDRPGEEVGRLGLRIVVAPAGGEPEELFAGTEEARARRLWRPLELDLERFAGEVVELELAVADATPAAPGAFGAWAVPEVVEAGEREAGWDLVLVSLDTLRADHLGAYGYRRRPTSPHLDAFAARGIRFARAVAQSPWTRPSHMSMFTGIYPASHGELASPLLAEVLRRHGWQTVAITGNGQVDARFGFDAGMDRYAVADWIDRRETVLDWLEESDGRRRFLFLHTYKIHDPYDEHEFTGGMPRGRLGESFGNDDYKRLGEELTAPERAYVEALYDGGIAEADRWLAELFAAFEERGVFERAIVVVTSDHGEEFWEHGDWRHGQTLYDHQLLVPLLLHLPPALEEELFGRRLAGTVVEEQVELLDLYPTLLELLGVPLGHRVQGSSLSPLLAGDAGAFRGGDAFAENTNIHTYERKGFRTRRFKFVKSIPRRALRREGETEPLYELYDLRRDPGEQQNIAADHPRLVEALDERLRALRRGGGSLAEELPEGIDPELEQRLRALGYLGE